MKHVLLKKMLRQYVLVSAIMLLNTIVIAQDISVSGAVTDNAGESLMGVTIFIKGTTSGAVTDADGNYACKAFLGEYEIYVEKDGKSTTSAVALAERTGANAEITLDMQ